MLKANGVKTKSVPRVVWQGIGYISIAIGIAALFVQQSSYAWLHVNHHQYILIKVTTAAEQTKGLGDRNTLPNDQGMLFVFHKPAVQCFWMKDMRFSLDMIWLDAQKHVVAMKQQVLPSTYPTIFCPTELAQYVIELNAGQAQKANMHLGETLSF